MGVCSEDAKFRHGILIQINPEAPKLEKTKKTKKTNVSRTTLISGLVAKSLFFLVFFWFSRVFFSDGAVVKCTDERGVHEADAWL